MKKEIKRVKKCYATGQPINENAKHVILVTKQGTRVLEETYFSIEGWKHYISALVNQKYAEIEEKRFAQVQAQAQSVFKNLFNENGNKKKPTTKRKKR